MGEVGFPMPGDAHHPIVPTDKPPENWGKSMTIIPDSEDLPEGVHDGVDRRIFQAEGTFTAPRSGYYQVSFGGVTNREAVSMVTSEELAAELLKRICSNWRPDSAHSKDTPRRFVESLKELCEKPEEFKFTTFPCLSDEMVSMGPIPFYTLCAHHVVPFHGNVWIGYVPKDVLCGLSKLARTVKYMAKGMWVQEELTAAIHNHIHMHMETAGIAVVVRAEHMCMSMRGVQVAGAITTTAKMSGVFMDHDKTAKAEFLHWMGDVK